MSNTRHPNPKGPPMPPTPTHTSRAGDTPTVCADCGQELVASTFGEFAALVVAGDFERCRFRKALAELEVAIKGADPRDATITLLTDLLANLLAARARVAHREVVAEQLDVAAWLAANRPEVDG
jgi:hypothetical protein